MSELGGVVGRVAAAIADGEPIQWTGVDAAQRSDRDHALLQQLRSIAWLESRGRVPDAARVITRTFRGQPILWLAVLGLATTKVGLALLFVWVVPGVDLDPSARYGIALASAFGIAAFVLVRAGRDDPRAARLGHFYLLTSAAFVHSLLARIVAVAPEAPWRVLAGMYPEAFLPFALWQFTREFPRAERFTVFDRIARAIVLASIVVGACLFVDSWAMSWLPRPPDGLLARSLWQFRRSEGDVSLAFWLTTSGLMVPGIAAAIGRAMASADEERRRGLWFLSAVAVGFFPVPMVALLRAVSPAFQSLMSGSSFLRDAILGVGRLTLLSIPFTTAYAVLVHRVLTIRLVAHRALQHLLARYTLMGLIALPIAIPLQQAYLHRDRRIVDILGDPRTVTAGWLIGIGVVLLIARGKLLTFVDRFFLGETLDPQATLAGVTEAITRSRTPREVAFETARRIQSTFGASRVAIVTLAPAGDMRVLSGTVPPLPVDTALLDILNETAAVIVNGEAPLFDVLPASDREWVLRSQFDLIARISTPGGSVAGFCGVGARSNGLPFSKPDIAFISAAMTTVSLALHRPWNERRAETGDDGLGALECVHCGIVGAGLAKGACQHAWRPALLPRILADKFEVVRRLGQGGMGVVYLGKDLRLGRPVALKTLPQVSASAAAAMFEEAKTMALVDHPHLAMIYALEVWHDTPVLVVEYLGGGALADRLADGPLPVSQALLIGADLADALSALHAAGILHRDIKPSNVGFTRANVPKLLDFGVARLLARAEGEMSPGVPVTNASFSTALVGTPLYLSPEALRGQAADPFVDLWGTSVVMLEAMTGTYPFGGRTMTDTLRRIRQSAPDWHVWRDQLPPGVVDFFARAFHADITRRPASAAVLASELRTLATSVS